MHSSITKRVKFRLVNPQLPLAVYREVAAHLRQVAKVQVESIARPLNGEREQFDYQKSQIEGLCLEYPQDLSDRDKQQVAHILDYYARRYGSWQQQQSNDN